MRELLCEGARWQVCSTLRPTRLAHPELFGLEGMCRFVSEFVAFEALEDGVQPPAHLASPASVLAWQVQTPYRTGLILFQVLKPSGIGPWRVAADVRLHLLCCNCHARSLHAT